MSRIIKSSKIIDKESPERKGTSIISDFKKFLNQDSIYEEYEVLLSDKDLWALMQIPFSPELAEVTEEISEPVKPSMEKKAVVSSKDEMIIREAIARKLDKAPSQLTNEDFQTVTNLDLSKTSLTKLEYLKDLTNLLELVLDDTQVSSLEPLKGLTNLQMLWLDLTQVFDLAPLKDLINLQELTLIGTKISNLEPLKGLTNLQSLYLNGTQVLNLEPLTSLTNLQTLWLDRTQASNLEPLKGLTNLQDLRLNDTQVSNLEPLKSLTNLKELWLRGCKNITDKQVGDLQKALPQLKINR